VPQQTYNEQDAAFLASTASIKARVTATDPPEIVETEFISLDDARDNLRGLQQVVIDELVHRMGGDAYTPLAPGVACQAIQVMLMVGGGGTGKTYVVESLVKALGPNRVDPTRRLSCVLKCALQGLASINIGGNTIHSILKINPKTWTKELTGTLQPCPYRTCTMLILATLYFTENALTTLQKAFRGIRLLVVDEYSMVGAKLLSQMLTRFEQALAGKLQPCPYRTVV